MTYSDPYQDRIDELFAEAKDLTPDEQNRLLDAACQGDPAELRNAVEKLLVADGVRIRRNSRHTETHVVSSGTASTPFEYTNCVDDLLNIQLEKYEIAAEIGRGAMGIVYRARHRHLDCPVAIKLCLPHSPSDRFHREAQLLAKLSSVHIVGVRDFEVLPDGRALLVMDWVEGTTLQSIIRSSRGPLDETRIVAWMKQVCLGMQAAADSGIVHRDLKP